MVDIPADLVLPDYRRGCLRSVLPAVATALGVEPGPSGFAVVDDGVPAGRTAAADLGLGPTERVCLVLVDGLGWHMLQERGGHAPFLRAALAGSRPIGAGCPATTATSLTMLGTGLEPGVTGILGYTLRHPRSGELINMLTWAGGASPEEWQPYPSLLERLTAAGAAVVSVGTERFRDSGLTRVAFRGGEFVGAVTFPDRVDAAIRALRPPGPRLVYVYWGDVDTVGHHRGWGSWEWGDEVTRVDAELARLVRSVPRGTTVVLTADHGMVDVGHRDKLDVATTPGLAEGVAAVSGEPRAVHVHVREGRRAEEVADRWRGVLAESAWVLTRDDAIGLGLFGQVLERNRPIVGDVVALMRGRRAVVDSRVQTPQSLGLVGMHGSLTPAEALVPFVVQEA